ncbi:hypothetical protein RO3G_12666 [Rhizopus delemar RA 99-880]|uniref:Tc1-like transposase DDE domain-containing protein n=1 Tax=Rhizopus delemar (strain RA 99-880 / ATCC MYA-4621 / FGSC 9543 / NRRL 43880) TaxID=246409 RepID=I1CHM5_RHIO9|nr:hypothetical protein RO3G_12666 [Rhizopus delemar RA 99-880]|eukprot:EIE87955.1 hypothetical protein RO3G_12666 [Rhizopus delemar RA 99-880]
MKRLQWAKSHQHWTVDDWKRVIFSDETKVNRFASDGKAYAWKLPHEELNSRHVQQTVKHGGGNIMVWSCLTWEGVGWIVDVGHRINSEGYLEVLKDDLLKTMESYGLDSSKVVFQQDNDPTHTSKIVKEWINQQPFEALEWPPQSPDLNPIEHMWARLKRELFHSYEAPPTSMHELWERIGQTWYAISKEECQKYIESGVGSDGQPIVVEIDESKFGKRKYNKGKRVDGVWVVGDVERTPERKVFLLTVPNRNQNTLKLIIDTFVKDGNI